MRVCVRWRGLGLKKQGGGGGGGAGGRERVGAPCLAALLASFESSSLTMPRRVANSASRLPPPPIDRQVAKSLHLLQVQVEPLHRVGC